MTFFRQYILLQLLLLNSYCFRRSSSCGVEHEELIEERRRQLQQEKLLGLGLGIPPSQPHLLFNGTLRNDLGLSVENAQVQFWHADYHGNYFHPGDDLDGKELMKESFSYFGTATTDAQGYFIFKTYRPGIYVSRPITHIHFKVFFNGMELLTSQFYFGDENVRWWYDDMVILDLEESIDDDGYSTFSTYKEVVVNMGMGGWTKLTPRDVEGPFYPLVDFFDVGSDMTSGLLPKFYEPTEAPTSTPPLSVEQVVSEFEVMDELLEDLAVDGNFTLEDSFEIDDSVDDDGGNEDNDTSSTDDNLGDGIISVMAPEDDKKKEKERKNENHKDKRSLYDYGDVRKRFLRSGE